MSENMEYGEAEMLTSKQLFDKLGVKGHKVRDSWRKWPHYMVGSGATIRDARFVYDEVKNFLRERAKQEAAKRAVKKKLLRPKTIQRTRSAKVPGRTLSESAEQES